MKRVSSTLAESFIRETCVKVMKGIVEPDEKLTFYCQVGLVRSFCRLGDRLNASGGNEAVMTARTRIIWIKSRVCKEGKGFLEERFVENEMKDLSELCQVGDVVRK